MKRHAVAFFLCAALTSSAATSTAWQVTGFADFLKGQFSGLSLTADGELQLGPPVRFASSLGQPALWSMAPAPDGGVFAATGHNGRVFHVKQDGQIELLWSSDQSEIFALCVDSYGQLYAASSPDGGVFLLANGKATPIWHSAEKYIWSLIVGSDGKLYAGTGDRGRVYQVDLSSHKAVLYYDTGQSNITALAMSPNGVLYVGSDPNGLLYAVTGPTQGSILYDSTLPEIRSIAVDSSGVVYAAAMGGAVTTRLNTGAPPSAQSIPPVVASSPTVITVTEAEKAQAGTTPVSTSASTSSNSIAAASTTTPVAEVSGVERTAIYRISLDRTVETLRSSKEDNVYDILLDGASLLFSTDDHGRIYRLDGTRATLIAEPGEGEATRLLKSASGLYASLSNPARVVRFAEPGSASGTYESQVHDSTTIAHWGHLRWYGTGSGIQFRTRTGNAARPDATWSRWSAPVTSPNTMLITSPAGRFIQWRAEWAAGSSARINTVEIPYLPQNTPPAVHSITVTSIVGTNPAKTGVTAAQTSSAYTVTVTDTGEPPATTSSTSVNQSVSHLQSTQTQISWQADDPDGDKLAYSVYFRADDEKSWQLLRSRMYENTLLLDPDVFADGRYFFRVVASDSPSNAVEYARQAELVSAPILIDNTPPIVTVGPPNRNGALLDVDVEAVDKTSPLRLCEYSLDAGAWQPIEAIDGVTDSPHERFHLHLDNLRPGEHLLVLRVYDTASNAGLARVVLQ